MFRNTYQSGFLSILFSIGSKPLQIWEKKVKNGHIKRITDGDIQSSVLEICGTNVSTTYVTCPAEPKKVLGIKLPFLVIIVKNLKKFFTFEVTVLDDKNVHRRFRASNYQATTRVKPFICTMPLRLDDGWNQIQFNLADFVSRAYGSNYVEALRVQVHANARIRRIFFSDKLYSEAELPPEFKLVTPAARKEAMASKPARTLGPAATASAAAAAAAAVVVVKAEAEEILAQDGAPVSEESAAGGGEVAAAVEAAAPEAAPAPASGEAVEEAAAAAAAPAEAAPSEEAQPASDAPPAVIVEEGGGGEAPPSEAPAASGEEVPPSEAPTEGAVEGGEEAPAAATEEAAPAAEEGEAPPAEPQA